MIKPLAVDIQNLTRNMPVSPAATRRWARAAFGKRGAGASLVVRFVGAAEGRRLNLLWRGRDYATNVLSFPPLVMPRTSSAPRVTRLAKEPRLVGDLVLCAPVVAREAREQGKSLADHYAHLIVHGCLHLLGHDHELDADAERMERQERRLLANFGIDDPYRVTESLPKRSVKKPVKKSTKK
ncbi:MAG: hypothetical protein RLY56_1083 [Pseudomonadota bacterium]